MRPLHFSLPALLALLSLGLLAGPSHAAGDTLLMEEVLICPGGDLYRSHLEADPIELQWVRGEFRLPTEGKVAANGEIWLRATADENGWIENEHLRNGHAFGNVTAEEDGIWLLEAMGYGKVYVMGGPRIGNVYGYTDDWQPWQPPFNFSVVPVELKQGPNHMYFSGSRFGLLRARFVQPQATLQINALDATLPDLVIGEKPNTVGSVVIMNCSNEFITKAKLQVSLDHQPVQSVDVPVIPPLGVRKVAFPIRSFETTKAGSHALEARVTQSGRDIHRATLELKAVKPNENRRVTFVSDIDGSVQFYGYLPAAGPAKPKALFLSLHGAAVDARNQSGSYPPYAWGHVVAPTNRRPFGFNWEDWGRLDALEVLDLAHRRYNIDPDRVYLTGHSMGGHGSWHLGTLYPDRFAAVGPSAGWISFWSYRPDQPMESEDVLEQMVQRATLPSRTLTMAPNLSDMGVYVLHGADDDNVRVEQAHMMVERLKEFHNNFVFHEEPDVGHWWDLSDAPGADCVSWAPMFDYFSRHRLPPKEEVQHLRFMTPSPGVSSKHHWAQVYQQKEPWTLSAVDLELVPLAKRLTGIADNVRVLGIDLRHTSLDSIEVRLNGDSLRVEVPSGKQLWLEHSDNWKPISKPRAQEKGPRRYGAFKDVFRNKVQFVVGTQGTKRENAWALARARYDAEYLWYQGNGSIDVLLDTMFDPESEPHRNVVLYGNQDTHEDWNALWRNSSVEVRSDQVRVGDKKLVGSDLAVFAVRPRPGSAKSLVGVISATGMTGFNLIEGRPYLAPGFAYPDFTVFRAREESLVEAAGFFKNDWSWDKQNVAWRE